MGNKPQLLAQSGAELVEAAGLVSPVTALKTFQLCGECVLTCPSVNYNDNNGDH